MKMPLQIWGLMAVILAAARVTAAVPLLLPLKPVFKSTADVTSAKEQSPPILFTDHGIFEGKQTVQPGGNVLGTPERRSRPLSLPAGTYRVLMDVRALTDSSSSSQPRGDVFLRLAPSETGLGQAKMNFSQTSPIQGISALARAERCGGIITLTQPFHGNVVYGAGGFGRQEAWFFIVPAQDTAFVPFGFGGTPQPLPRGAAQAAHHALTDGEPVDVYFLRLPAGISRLSLKVTTATGTPLPPGASSGGTEGGFGAAVDLLDQWGVTTQESFLWTRFGRGETGRQETQTEIKRARPGFIKLRVRPIGTLPAAAPQYVLTVEPAAGRSE